MNPRAAAAQNMSSDLRQTPPSDRQNAERNTLESIESFLRGGGDLTDIDRICFDCEQIFTVCTAAQTLPKVAAAINPIQGTYFIPPCPPPFP